MGFALLMPSDVPSFQDGDIEMSVSWLWLTAVLSAVAQTRHPHLPARLTSHCDGVNAGLVMAG